MDPQALQQFLQQQIQQGQQKQGQLLNRAQAVTDFANQQDTGGTAILKALLGGQGSNGVPISASSVLNPLATFTADNANNIAQAYGAANNATEQTMGAVNSAISLQGQQQSHDEAQQQLKLQAAINGLQPDGKGGFSYATLGSDPSGKGVQASPAAVNEVIKQGGSDLLNQAPDEVGKRMLAATILSAGGVGAYRSKYADTMTPDESNAIAGTNQTLTQLNNVTNRINNSPKLKAVMGDPIKGPIAKWAISSGNANVLHTLGLNSDDIAALSDMTALGASGERMLVGGRLSGYLVNRLGFALPSLDKKPQDNLEILNNAKSRLTTNLQAYAKQKGYKDYTQIPGITAAQQQQRPSLGSFMKP